MARSDRPVRRPARWGVASLTAGVTTVTAVTALLTAGTAQPPASGATVQPAAEASDAAADDSADGGAPADVSTFSKGWHTPWSISFLPDGRSALVTERLSYQVYSLDRDGSKRRVGEVPYTVPEPYTHGAGGLLGVAPSPTWNGTTDKHVFFVHTTENETRVARMSYDGSSLSGYTTVLSGIERGGDHNGGNVAFGPDGYLYVSTGDALRPELAQDRTSLNGKILRITAAGAPAPGNPFGNRVYSYGHRNPYGLAWDRNGRLWSAEIGESAYDELNLIKPGANYGWPACEGSCDVKGMTNPKKAWTPPQGVPAHIAIVRNVIYVASLRGQRLWRVPIEGDSERVGADTDFYTGQYGRLRAIARVPGADELWLGTSDRGFGNDEILRVTIKQSPRTAPTSNPHDPRNPHRKAGAPMGDTEEQETEPVEQADSPETTDKAAWQTPDYEVVDTALEVTGYYSPSSR